ncbi:TPA: hypothetical protein N0F65_001238 [Lagenidium giganteum]|uniref:WW domain-containing protein n=1 Tax=Lagenidium giganteum TaxID=4803 RepID=A0AAV2YUY9_9STRA|nr:TPA: hypothetical protein N0F65_001238 [Lagenidium giganteum]
MDATASHERPSDDPQAEEEAYDQLLQRMYHTQLDASAESAALQPDDVADDDWHFDASSPLRRSALNDAQDEHKSGDGDDIDATHQRASADDEERHEIRWVSDDGGEVDDDDQHNTSFGSIDWVAAHLQLSETDQGDSTMDEGVQEALAILNNSRAKFGSTRGSSVQDSMDQSDWQLSVGDDGKPYYYDIVHEAMSVMYRDEKPSVSVSSMAESVPESTGVAAQVLPSEMIDVDDQTGREEVGADNVAQTAEADSRPLDEEEKEEEKERDEQAEPNEGEDELSEEEKEEAQGALERSNDSQLIEAQYDEQTTHLARSTVSMRERYQRARVEVDRRLEVDEDNTDEPVVDEWKEAYTAKGRVYYYNRRTRESSWKR